MNPHPPPLSYSIEKEVGSQKLFGCTISNKLVSKVFAQKKGKKSYDSSNMCSNFGGFRCIPPIYVFYLFLHISHLLLMSLISCFMSAISCLCQLSLSYVCYLLHHVSICCLCLTLAYDCSLASCLLSLASCLLSFASCPLSLAYVCSLLLNVCYL